VEVICRRRGADCSRRSGFPPLLDELNEAFAA
jgi:hypothetical protein